MRRVALRAVGLFFVLAGGIGSSGLVRAQAFDHGLVLATPYIPTPQVVVDAMLRLARVGREDYLIDLGSGDGRIVLTAARDRGARGYGVDLDPALIRFSNQVARELKVASRARFEQRDVMQTPLGEATVVTFYLLPQLIARLKPRLWAQLKPGARIVAHDGDLGDWEADEQITLSVPNKPVGPRPESIVRLWVVPARVTGVWEGGADMPRLRIEQQYRTLSGTLVDPDGRECALTGQITGLTLRASACEGADAVHIEARSDDSLLQGALTAGGHSRLLRLTRQ